MTETRLVDPTERFQNFLKSAVYRNRLANIALSGVNSLIVNFEDLMVFDSDLADNIIERPDIYLKYVEDAALAQLKIEDSFYAEGVKNIHVRFRKLPAITPLRSVGAEYIGKLIMVNGILVRAMSSQPLLTRGSFKCSRCEQSIMVDQKGLSMTFPAVCENPTCRRTGPFDLLEEESEFINLQKIRVQEKPEDLPPGQLPRWLEVKLVEDLVDVARPGDRVTIVGISRTMREYLPKRGTSTAFELLLDANSVDVSGKESEIVQILPEEERAIRELSRDPRIHDKIIRSIAPSIYGYEHIKEAIMYLLFGGIPKTLSDGVSIRGDINVLLIGDPGTAKSQMLQYVTKIAPRGLYTSGRGSTAAGLTAAVIREKEGSMSLEAGALVLADRGICAIDEIDKMRQEDRVAIHEAMEQQTVSVAKGGIVATLNARASILAAANPALGRYDAYRTITENINLPVTILSRFDLVFIIKDEPNKEVDKSMAEHILELHKTGASRLESPIQPQLLRKYISYAKQFKPSLTDEAGMRLQEFYLQMRSTDSKESPVAITARQLEALVRLAEARARVAMRKEVTVEDAQAAILLVQMSMQQVGIDVTTGKMDIDIIMTGKPKSLRDKLQLIISEIVEVEKTGEMIRDEELYERVERNYSINRIEAEKLLSRLVRDGMVYTPKPGYLRKA
ncbi:MAG: minichromosome maintenance protein MCM [Candidatus Bathyarchaeota archaeon]